MAPRLPLREVVTSVHTHKDMPCRPQPLYMLQLWGTQLPGPSHASLGPPAWLQERVSMHFRG